MIPYAPLKVEHGVAYYDLRDVQWYGEPYVFGVENYQVVDHPWVSQPMVLDYKEETLRRGALRPIHRYSALKRFEYLLRQLLGGCRTPIPAGLLQVVREEMDQNPRRVWNSVRGCMKRHGYQKYFNRIPGVLKAVGYEKGIYWKGNVETLVQDFQKLFYAFHRLELGRTYFPSFRFFALKLLESRGCLFEYDIPLMHTALKLEVFEDLWELLEPALY
jgi:hypothetical protein